LCFLLRNSMTTASPIASCDESVSSVRRLLFLFAAQSLTALFLYVLVLHLVRQRFIHYYHSRDYSFTLSEILHKAEKGDAHLLCSFPPGSSWFCLSFSFFYLHLTFSFHSLADLLPAPAWCTLVHPAPVRRQRPGAQPAPSRSRHTFPRIGASKNAIPPSPPLPLRWGSAATR
jgi:hypothetical protein